MIYKVKMGRRVDMRQTVLIRHIYIILIKNKIEMYKNSITDGQTLRWTDKVWKIQDKTKYIKGKFFKNKILCQDRLYYFRVWENEEREF